MKLMYVGKRAFVLAAIVIIAAVLIGIKAALPASGAPSHDANKPIFSVDTNKKIIAISFDAEWGSDKTQSIMSILESRNVKGTFFLMGYWVDKYPDLVREISRRGHEIGNHSTNHPDMTALSGEQMQLEIQTANDKIFQLTGKRPILFRAPFGDFDSNLVSLVRSMNMHIIQWDVDSLDWKEFDTKQPVDTVMKKVHKGSIILFHSNARYIADVLPVILDKLKAKGYQIVPVSELIYKDNYSVDNAGVQHGR